MRSHATLRTSTIQPDDACVPTTLQDMPLGPLRGSFWVSRPLGAHEPMRRCVKSGCSDNSCSANCFSPRSKQCQYGQKAFRPHACSTGSGTRAVTVVVAPLPSPRQLPLRLRLRRRQQLSLRLRTCKKSWTRRSSNSFSSK